MKKTNDIFSKIYYPFCVIMTIAFVVGIFLVNTFSENWFDMDIYGDAMYAKYSAESKSFFPDNWIFGNQFYFVATPNLAALIYSFIGDVVSSLEIASCIMTVITILSLIWCLKPFVSKKGIIVGLFCFVGATIIGSSAAVSAKSFQVFFTMASYYSCYLIGAFFTLGIWLRLYYGKKVNPILYFPCAILNFALGLQSPREMLVLNLPLCAISIFLVFFKERPWKNKWLSKENIFAFAMCLLNLIGILLLDVLLEANDVVQNDILVTDASFTESVSSIVKSFLSYVGFFSSTSDMPTFIYRNTVALINLCVVIYVIIRCIINYIKTKEMKPVYILILFCVVSILAVVCAGFLFIKVRHIYYFMWHILVAFSYLYIAEYLKLNIKLHKALLCVLAVLGIFSLTINFSSDYKSYHKFKPLYQEMADTFRQEGVTHILYEDDLLFEIGARIAAFSDDEIITAAFSKDHGELPNEEFYPVLMLCNTEYFSLENCETTYVMISQPALDYLGETGRLDYFNGNATFKHRYTYDGLDMLFFSVTEELYKDIVS